MGLRTRSGSVSWMMRRGMTILLCRRGHYRLLISSQSRSGRVSPRGEGKTCEGATCTVTDSSGSYTGHSPERQTAVSETRDLRVSYLFFFFNFLFHNGAAQRIAIAAYAQGVHLPSLSFCCGESPRRRRVYDPVCVRYGKRLPLRWQFKLHVWGPLNPSSEMWNVAWAGALWSRRLVIYAMI